ncbi:hypothetical protein JVU11DRAFT_5719 [Chiua virens]|nr:hypothetical protein JVU11DRAFT_5719 [Chiua virens]
MRRSPDIALHTGFYLAATLTGLAAAYVLKEWIYHIWDTPHIDTDKPPHTSEQPGHSVPAPVPEPIPDPDTDVHSPPPILPKMLPPLRVNSLPPPIPGSLSGSFYAVNPDSLTSPTPLHISSAEEGLDAEASSQTTGSDNDSFVDVLSPHSPTQVISRRRSFFRNHDLFAESHMSFSQLGSLVAPENDSESE